MMPHLWTPNGTIQIWFTYIILTHSGGSHQVFYVLCSKILFTEQNCMSLGSSHSTPHCLSGRMKNLKKRNEIFSPPSFTLSIVYCKSQLFVSLLEKGHCPNVYLTTSTMLWIETFCLLFLIFFPPFLLINDFVWAWRWVKIVLHPISCRRN